jgi:phenylacetate-coenzyme A ligase PaaK-like adenylate-forming protein
MIGIPTWHLAVLRQLHDKLKFNKLTDVWKNLRIFFHGGVNFEPYRQQFIDLIGREDFIFYEIYNATEGFFGAQAKLYETGMLLLTDTSIFYEFIPFADYNTDRAKAIDVSEVQVGVPYVIVISAPNGLLRYVIGDVVTFTSTDPYTFNITGRTQEYINAFGEDLMLGHVSNALTETNKVYACSIKEYTVAPHYIQLEEKGKIQILIEFETQPADIAAYGAELDRQLQLQNSNYAQKRNNSIALTQLQVIVAKPHLFYNWLESKGKLGGQNKMPRLVNGRQIIDALLDMNH